MPETALVTGASSGIGAEFARQLAARGREVVLVARRTDRLEALSHDLPTAAHVLPCDLATEVETLKARVDELGVEVDLLVNNAGLGAYGRFWKIEEGRDAEQVRVNCEAVVTLSRAFVPGMIERGRGGIINLGSISGMQPLPYTATYAATKAFVIAFTDALHTELRGTGVHAMVVNPGGVPTEWQEVAGDVRRMTGPDLAPEQVVREALDAFEARRRTIVPGRAVRWSMRASSLSPRSVQLRLIERMHRPGGQS